MALTTGPVAKWFPYALITLGYIKFCLLPQVKIFFLDEPFNFVEKDEDKIIRITPNEKWGT